MPNLQDEVQSMLRWFLICAFSMAIGAALLVIAVLLAAGVANAHAIECKTGKAGNGHWTWRIVDGRRCWYPGRRKIAKALLHWPRRPIPSPLARPHESAPLLHARGPVPRLIQIAPTSAMAFAPPDPVHTFQWDPGEEWQPPASISKADQLQLAHAAFPIPVRTESYPSRTPEWVRLALIALVLSLAAWTTYAIFSMRYVSTAGGK